MKTDTMVRIIRQSIGAKFEILPSTAWLKLSNDGWGLYECEVHTRLHGAITWYKTRIVVRRYQRCWDYDSLRYAYRASRDESTVLNKVMYGVGSWYEETIGSPHCIAVIVSKRLLDRELNQEM